MSRTRFYAGRCLLALLSIVLAVVATELVLTLTGSYSPTAPRPLHLPGQPDAGDPFVRPDELLIYAGAPNARTFDWYSIEGHGYRTLPFSDAKQPGTLRVVVTGDSTTFGLGVLDHEHWSAILRAALAGACAGDRTTEVINAGVTGYSTFHYRHQIERDLLRLEPDHVVVLVSGANDATRVEGPGDAEVSASHGTWVRRLARLRIARMLGLGKHGWPILPGNAPLDSTTARPRVSLPEVEQNLHALADLAPERLVLGLFIPHPLFRNADMTVEIAERAVAIASERNVPLADVRPRIDELLPFPVYADGVHPTPLGHSIIARTVLQTLWPSLELSAERAAWGEAWFASLAGDVEGQLHVLLTSHPPPRFLELVALYEQDGIDARLGAGDPDLPAAARRWDPLFGTRCRARSRSRLLLDGDASPRGAILDEWVRSEDPLLACFGDAHSLLASSPLTRARARALIVFGAELGLVPVRVDLRRGLAARAEDPAEAVSFLRAVLDVDPGDDEARLDLAIRLRRAGSRAEQKAEFRTLAQGEGPLADFARGVIAYENDELELAEEAFRRAVHGRPADGWSHFLLGQVHMRQDALDDAARDLTMAGVLLGMQGDIRDMLMQVEERRRELSSATKP